MSRIDVLAADGRHLLTAEVADTPIAAARGLAFRNLGEVEGMWFPHVRSIHMIGMRFPLDVLFIGASDADGYREVIAVHRDVRPWVGLAGERRADGCLELPAGAAGAITPGERLRFLPTR